MTFSKFPAVGNGRMAFGDSGVYNGNWVDFAIRDDTVRVYNMQLRSMSIRWRRHHGLIPNMASIYHRLQHGYAARTVELAAVERYLAASPHPSIVCADINALPYSSTYQRLGEHYDNAFEERGLGFGFTYRNFPWFVRIDNQFFDPRLEITSFEVLPDINISDHYPIVARYALPKDG
jgi:endonuclease/exonuclease/phosphatase (EEP) superfamily protein YafD